MATYVILGRRTGGPLDALEEMPDQLEAASEALKQAGGSAVAILATQGAYDVVVIIEAPDDETCAGFVLGLGAAGSFSTETMRGFTMADVKHIIGRGDEFRRHIIGRHGPDPDS